MSLGGAEVLMAIAGLWAVVLRPLMISQMCIRYVWDWLLQWDLFSWPEEKLPNV
ncbi:hypothetical protein Gotur_014393 [Gossypium turneri]